MKASWTCALMVGAAWSTLAAGAAFAQEQPANEQAVQTQVAAEEAVDTQDTAVAEVVVTSRRVAESLQRAPLSVSAFTPAALDRIQARDTTELQGAVPNLNIVQGRASSNAANIFIRGVGQPDALQTFDPAVGVYVDDVYFSRIRGLQFQLLDLQRVEVLRGPQGTLFGKNTIGGALRFVTRRPDDTLRATGQLTVGSYNEFGVRMALSGPVSEGVALGFAALVQDRDGFVHDPLNGRDYNDQHTVALRAQAAFNPSENLQIDLSADYAHDDANLQVGQATNTLTNLFGVPLLVIDSNNLPEYDFLTATTSTTPNQTMLTHYGVSANVQYRLNDAISIRSITAYRDLSSRDYIDFDATPIPLTSSLVAVDQNQTSQEFQLNYAEGRWNVVGGLFFMRENIESFQTADAPAFTLPLGTFLRTVNDDLQTDSFAAYVNASFNLTERLRASAGIRYSQDTKDYFRTTSTFSTSPLLRGTFAFDAEEEFDDVSPSFSLDYQATDDILLYGRLSRGYKAGGFNGRANAAGEEQPYDSETVTSYELGIKTQFPEHRLRVNGSIFYNDYEDFQARVSRSVTSPTQPIPAVDFAVLNAGQLEISGAELEVAWNPVPQLLLDLQLGLLDAQYGEFNEQRLIGGVLTSVDRSFQKPAFAPDVTLRLGAQYEWDLAGRGFLTLGGQARYRDRHALAIDNSEIVGPNRGREFPGMFQGDYWLYDARVVWEAPSRNWSVALNGRNLSDEVYRTDAQEFSSVGGIRTVYYGAPSTVSLTITGRY